MQITKLIFKNFMGYKQLELPKANEELPTGLILISGQNSYGKSTILEGVLFAFFGPKIFSARNAASFITYGEAKAEVTVYFALDNKKYNIYRKWGRTGGTSPKLFEWVKTAYREIKNFNIENFFEISTEQALNTVFVRQGEVEELANKKGADLREMIIDLFRLNIIDDALSHLDKESKNQKYNKEKLEKNRVPIERIEEDINNVSLENTDLEKVLLENKSKKEQYEQKILKFPSDELISSLEKLYNKKEISEEKINSYKNDFQVKIKNTSLNINDFDPIENITKKIDLLTNEKNKMLTQKREKEEKRTATSKGLGKTKGRIDDTKENIKLLKDSFEKALKETGLNRAVCPTCQSELTKEHYDEMVTKFNKEIKINQEKIKSITKILDNLDLEIRSEQSKLDAINKRITIMNGLKQDYDNLHKYELGFKKSTEDINTILKKNNLKSTDYSADKVKLLSSEKKTLINEQKVIEKEYKEKQKKLETNQDKIIRLKEEITQMKDLQKSIGDLDIEIDHINKAKEFVRRFVTEYMVVKRLVKNIALTTNKYIKDFTSGQYSDLLLDLSGTRKTGLSLKIKDNFNGVHESIEVLSGGDKTALGMALRLAISELMGKIRPIKESPKKNPKIDILLLDEPLAALDATRRERILKHLIKSKTFSQIFLITHTDIPSDINTHKINVSKDHTTGISTANFKRETKLISALLNP
ncbi:MAG: AAA family ATPase [Candidatus Lokiarchaeota archaeon]|nr:AAA family ATPase [Candidatus Lokiarchaeota archaeon]